MRITPVVHGLADCRAAHQRIYEVERFDGTAWVPDERLAVLRDAVTHGGEQVLSIGYNGATHSLALHGKVGNPSFAARLDLTACGTAFVGSMTTDGGVPQAIRGLTLESVFHTERRIVDEPDAPFVAWEDFSIASEWVDKELKIIYRLGDQDVSNRVRVTKVDHQTGATTLEMVPDFAPPFELNSFIIVLAPGGRSFAGTYSGEDGEDYLWRGGRTGALDQTYAAVLGAAAAGRAEALAAGAPAATLSLQQLDNISSVQIVVDEQGRSQTVDFAQVTCGGYLTRCLANALDQKWIDGIYGHAFSLPEGVKRILTEQRAFFADNSVLGTGQALYDSLSTTPAYKDLFKRVETDKLTAAWEGLGKTGASGIAYQAASSALYAQGYRDGVPQLKPYLEDNPERWAEEYYKWLSDDANILTWQIQVASKQFDNVKTRLYEWYVKLQVLAPDKDYAENFLSTAYAALIGVNYGKAEWSDDLLPLLENVITQAVNGQLDPSIMDEIQREAALETQKILRELVTTQDRVTSLASAIAAAITEYQIRKGKKPMAQILASEETGLLIEESLPAEQSVVWRRLSRGGKALAAAQAVVFGLSVAALIYTLAAGGDKPLTPKDVVEDIGIGILAGTILVKGLQKLMALGVGRFLLRVGGDADSGLRLFAKSLATWFHEGGKVVPKGASGKFLVKIFGQNVTEFMARRIGPALAVVGMVLSGFVLAAAIHEGAVREIVFESLNAFFALADAVFIGIELFTTASAGPLGLAIAAVGIVVVLIQFIWGLIDPPPPPPDPVTDFVNGPMVEKGFARPA